MFENLRRLYRHYGGIAAVLTSWYFWVAAFLSALSYESIFDFAWVDMALSVMPSLTGFTIAAFAIIFAILDAELLKKLMVLGVSETLCMRVSPCGFDGSFVEPFWI